MSEVGLDQVLNQAVIDMEYRERLLQDPRAVLSAEGIDVPEEVEIVVVEAARDTIVLPLFPYVGDRISTEELDAVAGGRIQIRYEVPWRSIEGDNEFWGYRKIEDQRDS